MSFSIKKVHLVPSTMEEISLYQEIPQWNFRILVKKNEAIGTGNRSMQEKDKGNPRIRVKGKPKIVKCIPGKEDNTVQTGVKVKRLQEPVS